MKKFFKIFFFCFGALPLFFLAIYLGLIICIKYFRQPLPVANTPNDLRAIACWKMADSEIQVLSKAMSEEFNLIPGDSDYLGDRINDIAEINTFIFFFHKNCTVDIEEARMLFFQVGTSLVDRVNKNKELINYFVKNRYSFDNQKLVLHFRPEKREEDTIPIEVVANIEGRISYKYYDERKKEYVEMFSETYEEAVENLSNHLRSVF
jgi:hypothetical protein